MAEKDDSKGEERRRSERHLACFPAHVELPEDYKGHIALIRNVSVAGALLFTQASFDIGTELDLKLYLSGDAEAEAHSVRAEVVRSSRRELDRADLWPFSAAVQFTEPLTELEEQLKELAKRQEGLFGPA